MTRKVLIISSLQEHTPPLGYGGTERFVHSLANALTVLGFDITVMCRQGSLGGNYNIWEISTDGLDIASIENRVLQEGFSLVHVNTKIPELIESLGKMDIPVVVTLHNNFRKTSGWLNIMKNDFPIIFYTVISESLRKRVFEGLEVNNIRVPSHDVVNLGFGMDVANYTQAIDPDVKKDYYLYLGVIARYKGVLDIATVFSELDEKLKIVGPYNVDGNKDYFDSVMRVVDANANIEYLGETTSEQHKISVLNGAKALVVATGYDPLEKDCHEAFGLVMLEANSLGIPVIGYSQGNVEDYVKEGINGYKFSDLSEIPVLIGKINRGEIVSEYCIKYAQNFDISVCSQEYAKYFEKIIEDSI